MKVQTNFSTLGLEPQELVSFILDVDNTTLYVKQKESCKIYKITLPDWLYHHEEWKPEVDPRKEFED
jgi:hypothetical protein